MLVNWSNLMSELDPDSPILFNEQIWRSPPSFSQPFDTLLLLSRQQTRDQNSNCSWWCYLWLPPWCEEWNLWRVGSRGILTKKLHCNWRYCSYVVSKYYSSLCAASMDHKVLQSSVWTSFPLTNLLVKRLSPWIPHESMFFRVQKIISPPPSYATPCSTSSMPSLSSSGPWYILKFLQWTRTCVLKPQHSARFWKALAKSFPNLCLHWKSEQRGKSY